MSATTTIEEVTRQSAAPSNGSTREFLPPGTEREARTAEQIKAGGPLGFDHPATQVGVVGMRLLQRRGTFQVLR